MEQLSQRDLVLISFPFSDLEVAKVRPVVVLSNDNYNSRFRDFIAVPLTSNLKLRDYTVRLTQKELEQGRLITESKVKVDRVFSVSNDLVRMKIGRVRKQVHADITKILLDLVG
jgi:mRNA interferase MazF